MAPPLTEVEDLVGSDRDAAIPCIRGSFTGIYRWHAKRTLREVERVRVFRDLAGTVIAVAMTELLVPEAGYVYYVAVDPAWRRHGLGARLVDDALEHFRRVRASVVYAAVELDNESSLGLFRSRGFRVVERRELGFREGGLGAWGLRSRMRLVYGEVLLGLDIRESAASGDAR